MYLISNSTYIKNCGIDAVPTQVEGPWPVVSYIQQPPMPGCRASCFSPTKAYLTSVIPPEVKKLEPWAGQYHLRSQSHPTIPNCSVHHRLNINRMLIPLKIRCTVAVGRDDWKHSKRNAEGSCRRTGHGEHYKLPLGENQKDPNINSCWLQVTTVLNRKEALKQCKKWPVISDCCWHYPIHCRFQPCPLQTPLTSISCAVLFALAAIKNCFTGKTWYPSSRGLWTPQLYKHRAKPYNPGCTTKGPVSKAFYQAPDSQEWLTEGTCS